MTANEMSSSPWPDLPPPRPRPIVHAARNLAAAWKTMRCGEGSLRERWDVVDYYLAPRWTWTLRQWIRGHITHRAAHRREQQHLEETVRRLNQIDSEAQIDKQFWSIVANG